MTAVRSQQAPAGGITRSDIIIAVVIGLIMIGITALSVYCTYFCFTSGTISFWMYLGMR